MTAVAEVETSQITIISTAFLKYLTRQTLRVFSTLTPRNADSRRPASARVYEAMEKTNLLRCFGAYVSGQKLTPPRLTDCSLASSRSPPRLCRIAASALPPLNLFVDPIIAILAREIIFLTKPKGTRHG